MLLHLSHPRLHLHTYIYGLEEAYGDYIKLFKVICKNFIITL